MARRLAPLVSSLALLTPLFLVAFSAPAVAEVTPDVVVAVFDTGINLNHQEFAPGQVVAWWDFTSTKKTSAAARDPYQNRVDGQVPTWDPFGGPYDDQGHGTATASLVAGANRGTCSGVAKTSYAPGVKLAILKVAKGTSIEGDLNLAIRYAVDVLGADVLSLSLGAGIPSPSAAGDPTYEAIRHAYQRGVTVVFAAGNGVLGLGLAPYPAEVNAYGSSPYALVVGSGTRTGATATSITGNVDPDVSSWSDSVCLAKHDTTNGYKTGSGTSYSAPLVSGMAATMIREARAAGTPWDPATIESILKHAATDTIAPYAREGWGFLGSTEFQRAKLAAATGTLPDYHPYQGVPLNTNEAYDSAVASPLRSFHGDRNTALARVLTPASPGTGPAIMGPGAPSGSFEVEIHRVHLEAGQSLSFTMAYGALESPQAIVFPDIDVHLYVPGASADGMLLGEEILTGSLNGAAVDETFTYTATFAGDYEIALVSYGVIGNERVTLGSNVPLAFASEHVAVGNAQVV